MMKRAGLIILLITALGLKAQPPKNFYNIYGGNGIEVGYSVKQTLDRQYIVAGSTSSWGAGNSDFYMIRVDSMGRGIWQTTFGGFTNDVAMSVIQLSDSSYVLTGYSNSFGSGGYDILTIRTDKFGNKLWQRSFGGTDWDFGYDAVEASDGNIVVCGSTTSFGNGKSDGVVLKYDLNGNLLWQKYFGGTEDDDLRAIIRTNDNLIACAGLNKSVEINGNGYLVKLDLNGDTIFTRNFGGAGRDFATDLVQIKTNDYVVVGAKTFTGDPSHTHSYYIFYNAGGSFKKDTSFYNSTGDENYTGVIDNPRKDTFCVAYLRNVPVPNFKMQGNIFVSNRTNLFFDVNSFGGYEDETFYGIDRTRDKGFICVGTTQSYGALDQDVILVKLDSTIVNYQSVVGIREKMPDALTFLLKNLGNNTYQVVSGGLEPEKMILYDLYGSKISEQKNNTGQGIVSLNNLAVGIYILQVSNEDGKTRNFKIIKD